MPPNGSALLLGLWWWCIAFVVAQLPGLARALDVRWHAPADVCPDAADVAARVARTLGPRAKEEDELVVEARVTAEGDHWLLQVRLAGAHASDWSTLSAQSCEALAEATAVIAAALLPAPPPPVVEQPEEEAPEPQRIVPFALEVVAGLGAERGALPEVSPAFAAGLALTIARVRAALVGSFLWPREASVAELPEARPQVGLYTVGLSLCYDLAVSRVSLSPCAAMEAGQLFARERGLASGGSGRAPWIAPGGSLALRIPLRERWLLSPEVLVFAPIRESSFTVGPEEDSFLAHRSETLSIRGLLTLGLRFWSLEKLW